MPGHPEKATIPEPEDGEALLNLAYCLTTPAAELPHGVMLGSRNVVLEDVHINAALRQDRQPVHEAKNLAMHLKLFSDFPEHDGRGHTWQKLFVEAHITLASSQRKICRYHSLACT